MQSYKERQAYPYGSRHDLTREILVMAIVNLPLSIWRAVKNRPFTSEVSLWSLFFITSGHRQEERVVPNCAEERRGVKALHSFDDVQLVFF